jgi:GMP synthase-like glutamine amidotransferase
MKPIAIFRHAASEGPGYFAEFLEARQIPWRLIAIDEGTLVPASSAGYSGLVFMGGPMSVNDPLPWIAQVLDLIQDAVARDIAVLGHCLGGQLISKALGGEVSVNPVKEIGWGVVTVADNDTARDWFGEVAAFEAFHWHGETFSLPQDAHPLLASEYCSNQAFAIGKHLVMQCHVEVTAEMIANWCVVGKEELAAAQTSPAVQSAAKMQQQTKLPQLHKVAERLYTRWLAGL